MAIRGVYSDDEKKMLAEFEKIADDLSGWDKSLRRRVATEESIRNWALAMDCWNPLWYDEGYAPKTRWGGVIANPMYQECITLLSWLIPVTPAVGYVNTTIPLMLGEDWEFFRPIRSNDSFKVWRRRPILEDVTSEVEDGLRKFHFVPVDADLINQRDELVSSHKIYIRLEIVDEFPKEADPTPPYKYRDEELELIEDISRAEEIRGDATRYWEDIALGDEAKMVVTGPTTVWDMAVFTAGRQDLDMLPMMEIRKRNPEMLLKDPITGVTHHGMEMHLSERVAHLRGLETATHSGAVERQTMVRLVTNWMGDDGFLRKFKWRYFAVTYMGDTLIGRGKVVDKRVENSEYLVDLDVWLENLKGHIASSARATVSLCAKADL